MITAGGQLGPIVEGHAIGGFAGAPLGQDLCLGEAAVPSFQTGSDDPVSHLHLAEGFLVPISHED